MMFNGRMSRLPFLIYSVVDWILFALASSNGTSNSGGILNAIFLMIFVVGAIWVGVYSRVKRLHDLDFSGWWVLLLFIQPLGLVMDIILLFKIGTDGENRFGDDPLD